MKLLDKIVMLLFIVVLTVLCFFQKCSLDIFFLVFGFAVATFCIITFVFNSDKIESDRTE